MNIICTKTKRRPYFKVFKSALDNQWRWHLKAANGRVIAQGEGHENQAKAVRAYKTVMKTMYDLYMDYPENELEA